MPRPHYEGATAEQLREFEKAIAIEMNVVIEYLLRRRDDPSLSPKHIFEDIAKRIAKCEKEHLVVTSGKGHTAGGPSEWSAEVRAAHDNAGKAMEAACTAMRDGRLHHANVSFERATAWRAQLALVRHAEAAAFQENRLGEAKGDPARMRAALEQLGRSVGVETRFGKTARAPSVTWRAIIDPVTRVIVHGWTRVKEALSHGIKAIYRDMPDNPVFDV